MREGDGRVGEANGLQEERQGRPVARRKPADVRSYLLFHLHESSSLFLFFFFLALQESHGAEAALIR